MSSPYPGDPNNPYGSNPYQQPVYGQPVQPVVVAAPPNNQKALISMILGIVSYIGFSILTGIPAVILGHMALKEINASAGTQGGKGMAIAGLVLGYLSIALIACVCIYFVFVVGLIASSPS